MCHSDTYDQLYVDIPYSRVSKVRIRNRLHGYRDRQIGMVVSVNGVACGTVKDDSFTTTIHCPNVPGNQVMLSLPFDNYINLMQVEVFGTQVPKLSNLSH